MTPCPCPSRDGAVRTIGVVPIEIDECWAIDRHWDVDHRTPLGELLHRAKTYGTQLGDPHAADELAACLAWWAAHLAENVPVSKIEQVDVVCCVPDNPSKKPFNLPDRLAAPVAARLGVPYQRTLLRKRRPTHEVKYTTDKAKKIEELAGAFAVDGDVVGKSVLVVDDLVLSGATLETLGALLREAGASRVIALAATRATKGIAPNR